MDDDEFKRIAEETYQQYKDKPITEVDRKIKVVRSLTISAQRSGGDIRYQEARMAGLDRVDRENERRKRRREGRDEARAWSAETRSWVTEARKWIVPVAILLGGLGTVIA